MDGTTLAAVLSIAGAIFASQGFIYYKLGRLSGILEGLTKEVRKINNRVTDVEEEIEE